MKCFHFQNFSCQVYQRALARYGFATVQMVGVEDHSSSTFAILARRVPECRFEPAPPSEINARLSMYGQWRDESLLALPLRTRELLGGLMSKVAQRAIECGYARETEDGPVPVRRFSFT